MNTTYLLIVLSFVACGCFSSTLVTPSGEKGDLSYPQFNGRIGNDEASINFRDGRSVSGQDISISRDTISWVDSDTHIQRSASVENIRNVGRVNHTISALVGLGMGAAVGVGVAISGTSGPHNGGGEGFFWVIAPPSGALIGAGIGALVGSASYYEFNKESTTVIPGSNK